MIPMPTNQALSEPNPNLEPSPNLFGMLRRTFPDQLSMLVERYREAALLGGLEEAPVIREPGVSFNPRPSRLGLIIINDGGVRSPAVLSATFYTTVRPTVLEQDSDRLRDGVAAQLARKTVRFLASPESFGDICSDSVTIAFAIALDQIRHLHMTHLSPIERQKVVAVVEKVLSRAAKKNGGILEAKVGHALTTYQGAAQR